MYSTLLHRINTSPKCPENDKSTTIYWNIRSALLFILLIIYCFGNVVIMLTCRLAIDEFFRVCKLHIHITINGDQISSVFVTPLEFYLNGFARKTIQKWLWVNRHSHRHDCCLVFCWFRLLNECHSVCFFWGYVLALNQNLQIKSEKLIIFINFQF